MIRRIVARGEGAAQTRQRLQIERIAAALEAKVAGVAVETTESAVIVSGRALVRRWLSDPALRFAGRLSK